MIQFKTDVSNNSTKIFHNDEFVGYLVRDKGGFLYNPAPEITLRCKWYAKVEDLMEDIDYRGY